jgi:tetratricopeptide (TPR) repeat protein
LFKFKDNSAGQRNWTAISLPDRARGMDAPSQRESFKCRNTLSISRVSAKASLRVQFEPNAEIGQKGRFCRGRELLSMMSVKIIGRKVVYLVVGLFLVLTLSTLSYGETDFGRLFTIRDKGELKRIISEAEKVIEKDPEDKDSLKTLGIAYHNLGDIGVKTAPQESVRYLKKAKRLYPDDALILAVLGSSTTMLGKYSKERVKEGKRFVNKGGDMIDRAVISAPDDVLVRILRANNSRGLPKSFGRRHYFKEDLLHVKKLMDESPSAYDKDLKAHVYFRLGVAYNLEADESSAKVYFRKAIEVAPDSKWGEKAQRQL